MRKVTTLKLGRLKIPLRIAAPLLVLLLFIGPLRNIVTPTAGAQAPEPPLDLCISGLGPNGTEVPANPHYGRIVQNCTLRGYAFRALESQLLDTLLEVHQLPEEDEIRLLAWERDTLRAVLFTNLIGMILKAPEDRSASEQQVVDYVAELVKQRRIAAAEFSKSEWIRWTLNPCDYQAPYGFTYQRDHAFCDTYMGGVFDGATPPTFEDFVNYGNAHIYQDFQAGGAAYGISAETARMIGLAAGLLAAAIGGGIAAMIGSTLSVTSLLIQAIHPFLAVVVAASNNASAAAAVAGAAAGGVGAASIGAMVAIIIFAIVVSVIQGLTVAEEAAIPMKLDDALAKAQQGVNLQELAQTEEGRAEIYAAFILQTLPDYSSNAASIAPVPAQADSDPRFWVTDAEGNRSQSATIAYQCWNPTACGDGPEHTARLSGGWFVDKKGAAGEEMLTLNIDYINWDGEGWTATRIGPQEFLHTRTGDEDAEPFTSTTIKYTSWNGAKLTAEIDLPPPIPNPPVANSTVNNGVFTLTWDAVTDPNGDPVTYSLMRCNATGVIFLNPCTGTVFATGLTGTSLAFTSAAPESHGRWVYRVAASSGESTLGFSGHSQAVVSDREAPTITLVSRTPANAHGWHNTDVTLIWSCVDGSPGGFLTADSGVVAAEVSQTLTDDGEGQIAIGECEDNVGNVNTDRQENINIDKSDPLPDTGGPYIVDEGGVVLLDGSDSTDGLSGIDFVQWDLSGGEDFGVNDPATFSWPDGPSTHTVKLRVVDKAGNESITETTVTVNNVAPRITNIQTNAPVPQGKPAELTISATDPAGDLDPLTFRFDCDGDGHHETPGVGNVGTCKLDPAMATSTIGVEVDDGDGGITRDVVNIDQTLKLCGNRSTAAVTEPLANGNCPAGTTEVTQAPAATITLCIHSATGEIIWSQNGKCSPSARMHLIPNDGPLPYCQNTASGKLRANLRGAACSKAERAGVIPGY